MTPGTEPSQPLKPVQGALLLGGLLVLLLAWSLVIPIFEAPDEPAHWKYARYLHDHWRLPIYGPDLYQANSPPLYYVAIAPLATENAGPAMVMAPDGKGGVISLAPPRWFLNTDRDFSRYGPIRWARALTALLSLVTVWLTYAMGTAATGRREVGLLAALAVALLPQFTFRASNVSSDPLVTLFGAATMLGVTILLRSGFTWSRGVWTAVALACAYLSKISAIALLVPVAYALVMANSAPGQAPPTLPRRALRLAVLLATIALVLPWTLRNISLYGDPFASEAMRTAVAHLVTDRSLFSRYFLYRFPLVLSLSFLGSFGWANLLLPKWAYAAFGLLILAASFGLAVSWRRRTLDLRLVVALTLAALSTLAVVVHINLSFTQAQGRYLFPALPALGLLAALGWSALPSPLTWLRRPVVIGTVLTALNLYSLIGVAGRAYYPAMARDEAPGVRRLPPTTLSGLAPVPATGDFTITSNDPSWIMPVDVDASEFGALELVVRASLEPRTQQGCVRFATDTKGLTDDPAVCFAWQADGAAQRIVVPLATHPRWRGLITALHVDILDGDAEAYRGQRLKLERQNLVAINRS